MILTVPGNCYALIYTEAIGSLEGRDLSSVKLREVLVTDATLFSVDLDRKGVNDLNIKLIVCGHE